MFPINHKTVMLIDSRKQFKAQPSGQSIDFDVYLKNRNVAGLEALPPISKSLWTCAIESIQEISRILRDLFAPSNKMLEFVCTNFPHSARYDFWDLAGQNLSSMMDRFAEASVDPGIIDESAVDPKCIIKPGLITALAAIASATPQQLRLVEKNTPVINRGRIILVSCFHDMEEIKEIVNAVIEELKSGKEMSKQVKDPLPISEIHLVVISTYPLNSPLTMTDVPPHKISDELTVEVITTKSGSFLAGKFLALALSFYGLGSTTVTGIPMKEEQNASTSSNYDVELVHPLGAHFDLFKAGNITDFAGITSIKEGVNYETVSLKWCTPRNNNVELHHCSSAYRLSPVDVNSRHSSCLTNFLLSGRTVMLEMTKSKGSKMLSHMLSNHNGDLYIHTLAVGRSILEDPPSISEGTGGRVTDYRINDFGELMKSNRLTPFKMSTYKGKDLFLPIDKAINALCRQTLYWPMTIGHTFIFNLQQQIQALLACMPKESLTPSDVNDCKEAIYQIVKMESKGTYLGLSSIATRGKGPKREELYKLLWKELEYFIEIHASTPEHKAVLQCLREIHSKNEPAQIIDPVKAENSPQNVAQTAPDMPLIQEMQMDKKLTTVKDEVRLAWKEMECYNSMTEREKAEFNMKPTGAQPVKKPRIEVKNEPMKKSDSGTLLGLWSNKLNQESKRRPTFEGRTLNTNIAPLYTNLKEIL